MTCDERWCGHCAQAGGSRSRVMAVARARQTSTCRSKFLARAINFVVVTAVTSGVLPTKSAQEQP